jgi:NTP pyrophosphatase (non-canonical NTP hydrolase)
MDLPDKPILNDYQKLISQLVLERGFEKETVTEVFTLLVEEVGELAKAIRKANNQKVDENSKKHDVEEEVADVFWLLLDVCNRLNIDLEKSFRAKEAKNQTREWKHLTS